jgi:hypothetical protein
MTKKTYLVEITDTFCGEANYAWGHEYLVSASSLRGAISKVSRHTGYSFRVINSERFEATYDATNACVRAFVGEVCPEDVVVMNEVTNFKRL